MTMKINGGRINTAEVYANKIDDISKVKCEKNQIQGRSFDSVMIESSSREKIEKNIHEMGKKTVLKNVYTNDISNEKLAQIKQQVLDGTYQVDANLIADRLMMFR